MKITKYNQSTLLLETNNKRILIDPSSINYSDELVNNDWTDIDAILITHKHSDHCNKEAINTIVSRDNSKVFTSSEVSQSNDFANITIVKAGDIFSIGDIKVETTKAIHGYMTGFRESGKEIIENIGFIVDDGDVKLYTTSDTINFYNDYTCDILCMPFNGNGITLGIVDGISFIKGIKPKFVLPVHMQHPLPHMNPNVEILRSALEENDINYKILSIGESIEF